MTWLPADVVETARAHGRTIAEVLLLRAFEVGEPAQVTPVDAWVPLVTHLVIGPVRPLSFDEAMDTRLGRTRVRGSDLHARVDYQAMCVTLECPKPFVLPVTEAGRARWITLLAEGCDVPLCVGSFRPETYVRPGYEVEIKDLRILG